MNALPCFTSLIGSRPELNIIKADPAHAIIECADRDMASQVIVLLGTYNWGIQLKRSAFADTHFILVEF